MLRSISIAVADEPYDQERVAEYNRIWTRIGELTLIRRKEET
jgi:hypothetical protein